MEYKLTENNVFVKFILLLSSLPTIGNRKTSVDNFKHTLLRYGLDPVSMSSLFECKENFTVALALHCLKGGYMHMRHNEVRDFFPNLLVYVCHDVEIERQGEIFALRSTTTDDEARFDIKVIGLWSRGSKKPVLM